MVSHATPPFWRSWMTIVLHLATFFVAALVSHAELARSRPSIPHLTEYYLWISTGGVLGGLFNALIAPVIFTTAAEYSWAIALACLLVPRIGIAEKTLRSRLLDLGLPLALGALSIGLLSGSLVIALETERLGTIFHLQSDRIVDVIKRTLRFDLAKANTFLRYGPPILLCYLWVDRPLRFALGVGAILFANSLCADVGKEILHRERSFFGVLRVERDGSYNRLVHGTTLHGMQARDPARRREPLTYYHWTGPIGQVFETLKSKDMMREIAIVGLGRDAGELRRLLSAHDLLRARPRREAHRLQS